MDKTTEDRIKADAEAKYNLLKEHAENEWDLKYAEGFAEGWHEGATAENNRTQNAIDILEEAYNSHLEEKRLLVERYPHLFPNIDNYVKPWVAKAKEFLQQWNGTGKEPVKEEPETSLTDLGLCMECKTRPAITDYNNHGHYVCKLCDDFLNRQFDEEYR